MSNCDLKTITLDGIEYVRKDDIKSMPEPHANYVIVRGNASGVFAGHLVSRSRQIVELNHCRRLWYWDGAASLSQLAMEGVKAPENCKFSVPTTEHHILDAIEIIPCSSAAKDNIKAVKAWAR